jgi:cytosine/adenosine deaminase-related metal-dependent hydrolase
MHWPHAIVCRAFPSLKFLKACPAMDLVLRNANLPDGRTGIDIGIQDGRIAAVEPRLAAQGRDEIDASGRLVTPPFIDSHFHLDATLSLGLPRINRSGTLLEGIALWGELKPQLTQDAVIARALAYCDLAAAQGLLAIRSHVDVCDDRLLAVEALLEVKRRVAPYLDLQLVAFPQDGLFRSATAERNLLRSTSASTWSAASRISSAPWPTAPPRSAGCARSRRSGGCRSTCIATRATTRSPATSRRWRRRPTASASAAG